MSTLNSMADESPYQQSLRDHLAWWGLRQMTSDRDYFVWQRQQFSPNEIEQLTLAAGRKRTGGGREDIAFYDFTAHPTIYPALYSQRYDYYEAVGLRTLAHLGEARAVLDFGCGLGILTTFYARQFTEKTFMGLDRSAASIAVAQRKAEELGLRNLRFLCLDIETESLLHAFDLVVTTHALLQAEQDLGIPSRNWRTFDRADDPSQQAAFEQRTGLSARLDRLCRVLRADGHMIVSEKTRQLARRVPFQRALAGRGLRLVEPPALLRYRTVEEIVDDGPFYVLHRGDRTTLDWDESPEQDEGTLFDFHARPVISADLDTPLYENHWPSAQAAWVGLHDRVIIREVTRQASDGRQVHAERGRSQGLQYLYCANTFDQRQLVIVDETRSAMLDTYYQEILRELP